MQNNFKNLSKRAKILKKLREFFWQQNFLEVETPNIVSLPGQEPYLSPVNFLINDEKGRQYSAYLHTSPEYTMKKMLASGFENIFSICKCFRDKESFGGIHNPEFTMLEWYRVNADFFEIMQDVENLFASVGDMKNKFQRIHMRDLWQKFAGVNLDDYLEKEKMFSLCLDKGFKPSEDESYEDLFYRIFLNMIEPQLNGYYIVHHYPAQMAALAKLSDDERYAERFEVYVNGIEIANAFSELTDAKEQKARLVEERKLREKLGASVYNIDEDFVDAVDILPKCAGIALGVDRLVQVLLGCQNIDNVLVLPASKIFK
ncbi:MAG: EF-P lysine aminoacylase GenX [Candidatus Magasanikbacteria bacterium RIFCSPHIGHO2_01_FULL_33_34]|uniref:EF-P lysine aminoacylase GenX n=1 Tax=Candidatus Magasanikbacteria bacterium RIFCSPHIGHO2_01_FULL_33_34 TaxID=1798671 RepID=A0A1F6LHB3_9BACT|nr:MAG: EF-P lysine aminoacylase GenX [Candidatus Magasanikbacteria bacterium RIFCSPHIGHO2_01_FULL_33_34]OGH66200.1 MAG: EF-P lysine aminoacylase GenX [Candidatus Magasanikbacteria bacterium RIFCSPHIGHO2_02_FULL_33_17]OGH76046.1 MAG: EF-P lysine aminoacylase GenX [Candidatus Magasanikbacteria bacterium RIFCSPLOWO2_01_FULL_33_34]